MRAPSALPGWTRGHVLTHLARNADSLVNLLTWAATGVEHSQYRSRDDRDAAIEAGSARHVADQIADLKTSARGFADAVAAVPASNWDAGVRWLSGDLRPASQILDARLREVAIHHIDLNAGYSASDWSSSFALKILLSVLPAFEVRGIEPVTLLPADIEARIEVSGGSVIEVRGPTSRLAMWLLGRDDGSALTATGGSLPTPPAWT